MTDNANKDCQIFMPFSYSVKDSIATKLFLRCKAVSRVSIHFANILSSSSGERSEVDLLKKVVGIDALQKARLCSRRIEQ